MSRLTLWHNPRCSKSRATLALLSKHGVTPEVVLYLETPPTADQIRQVLKRLGKTAIELVRTGENAFSDMNLSKASTEESLIEAMVANPILIERPVVISKDRAALGRPPENVLSLI